jgi:hypothetical protein
MKRFALLLAVLLFVSTLPTMAQVAIIDTRADQPAPAALHIVGGTGGDGGVGGSVKQTNPLHIELSVSETRPHNGDPFAYDLLLTNRSDKEVLFPQSVRWSDVAQNDGESQIYQEVAVSFAVIASDGNKVPFGATLSLYGSKDKPDTMVTLAPGQSLRILGNAYYLPGSPRQPQEPSGKLQAYLAVNSVRLTPVKQPDCRDCYFDHEQHLFWTQSENPVEVEFLARVAQ